MNAPHAPPGPGAAARDNAAVADLLREMATLLEAQGEDNAFRIAAYRRAADTVAALPDDVRQVFERDGLAGLDALPTIGPGIAAAIAEIVQTGRWARLDRLRGAAGPEAVFRTIPGVGATLALRLHDELGVETLEALEAAAHDGRLERLPHIGARRAASIRAALTQMLDRARTLRRRYAAAPAAPAACAATAGPATAAPGATMGTGGAPAASGADDAPTLEVLLEVDRQYREAAAADRLPKIAPRRFNPEGKAWLPVLHTRRGDWAFTALYSNTARAHELGRVHDWVVIYAEDAAHRERQYTVVSVARGPHAGQRIVRGREGVPP